MKPSKRALILIAVLFAVMLLFLLTSGLPELIPPSDPALAAQKYFEKGNQYVTAKEYNKGVEAYSKSIKYNPVFTKAYYNRGVTYQAMKKYPLAARDLAQAAQLNPSDNVSRMAYKELVKLHNDIKERKRVFLEKDYKFLVTEWSRLCGAGLIKSGDGNNAEGMQLERISLPLILAAKKFNPTDKSLLAMACLAKASMYLISGKDYLERVKANFDNYSLIVILRKSYYPLKCADYYADAALQYAKMCPDGPMKDVILKNMIPQMKEAVNYRLDNSSRRWLDRLDTNGRIYMKNTDNEAAMTVNFDLINNAFAAKDFKAALEFINKNEKLAKELVPEESININGYINLHNAYTRLNAALLYMHNNPKASTAPAREMFNICLNDLAQAQAAFKNEALYNSCEELKKYVMRMANNVG